MENNDDKLQFFEENEGKGFERFISGVKKALLGIVGIIALGYVVNKKPEIIEEVNQKINNQKQ
ncbi:MAG: hypothetical protein IJI41_10045 [Anaerolineaceae bacterium]|nr:hypothetical protein [Anaerolineaceae bacterium]